MGTTINFKNLKNREKVTNFKNRKNGEELTIIPKNKERMEKIWVKSM